MLEAYVSFSNEILKLPRSIKKDKKIKFEANFSDIFCKQYEKVFDYNLAIKKNVLKDIYRNQINCLSL